MTRKEKIEMLGRENLEVWPWTRLRTIVLVTFLGLGVLFITLGIIFWGHHSAPGAVVFNVSGFFYNNLAYNFPLIRNAAVHDISGRSRGQHTRF